MRAVTRDVKRVFPGDSQAGRASVVATYQGQFRGNKITGYEISDLDVSGGRSGRASGTYKLSGGAATTPADGSSSASSAPVASRGSR